jgi:hypothetical protein
MGLEQNGMPHGAKLGRMDARRQRAGRWLLRRLLASRLAAELRRSARLRIEAEAGSHLYPVLCPCDLHAQLFRQPFADLRRQAVMHAARAFLGRIQHGDGRGGGNGHYQPDQRREGKAG